MNNKNNNNIHLFIDIYIYICIYTYKYIYTFIEICCEVKVCKHIYWNWLWAVIPPARIWFVSIEFLMKNIEFWIAGKTNAQDHELVQAKNLMTKQKT